ncbi:MAG: isoprenylcysteine carboxylmethyltransferase family protein [Lachnospiraceae bacterium]|nr:isoprenylcysteine carboxylmethyltransferase family protein [Lachnospiraceae bacterium]
MKRKLLIGALSKFLAGLFLLGLLLFVPAGTVRFPGAWRLIAILFLPMLILGAVLFFRAPDLLEKRLNSREKSGVQKTVVALSALEFIACFVLAGLDFRFGWSHLPAWLIAAACVLFVGCYGLYAEVMRENAYLSRTVEVQEGQKVISSGLYGLVRHPMYFSVVLLFWAMPLVLGSVPAFLVMLPFPALLVRRIKDEEAILEEGLPGYREYEKKVRFRLIPFVW